LADRNEAERRADCLYATTGRNPDEAPTEEMLELDGAYVSDRLEQPSVVEPIYPFERCELNRFDVLPRSTPSNN
jgi:hypothetical protein